MIVFHNVLLGSSMLMESVCLVITPANNALCPHPTALNATQMTLRSCICRISTVYLPALSIPMGMILNGSARLVFLPATNAQVGLSAPPAFLGVSL